ncbi:MAG: histidine triad nucleotide-binding protein [Verrucomicrobiales bacterium]
MTLFEKIAAHTIPADIVYEDDQCIAFHDINPQAPIHVLIVPRKPIVRVGDTGDDDAALLGRLLIASGKIAAQLGVKDPGTAGYRLVINHGRDAGESVPHLHLHFLAGRSLAWPPG